MGSLVLSLALLCGPGRVGGLEPLRLAPGPAYEAARDRRVGPRDTATHWLRGARVPRRDQCRTVTVTSWFSCTQVIASVLPTDG
jgi:hypothetical protein